jgi:hypothetical protein
MQTMKRYITGYYCRDDAHLQVLNKDSNRKILDALADAYPAGLTVEQLSKKTKLPIKTIYAQKAELFREYYVDHLETPEEYKSNRGRPSAATRTIEDEKRKRVRLVIEDASGVHDPYQGKKPTPLPPGNVVYSDGFTEAWHNIVGTDEEDELCEDLLQFIRKGFDRITVEENLNNMDERLKKKWRPETTEGFCCSQCGLNHEARDFIRAMLLQLIDRLEKNDKFIAFLKNNQLLTQEAYDRILTRKRSEK